MNQYETVFILTPVLSEAQVEEAVQKFNDLLKEHKAEIINQENWGLKKLAYSIQNKRNGFYHLIQYQAAGTIVADLELAFKRDERILRYLTVKLDKHAVAWAQERVTRLKTAKA